MKSFNHYLYKWIENFASRGSVGVKMNDDIGHYFRHTRVLDKVTPLSPILFNLVADMLAILITRDKEDGQVEGLIPHLVDRGISILRYENDTEILMDHDLEKGN
jgi:hypothetical protein